MKRARLTIVVCLVLALLALAVPNFAAGQEGAKFAADRIIVKFKQGTTAATQRDVHRKRGGTAIETIGNPEVQVVKVPSGAVGEKVQSYKTDENVEYAEPDYVVQAYLIPNDGYFTSQWGLNNLGQVGTFDADIDAPEAWDLTKGDGVKIAILDTGVDQNHEDLKVKLVANKNFTSSKTVDDKYGHGTHVAGIAAAITNNSVGVAGVGFNAQIMNVKVLNDNGSGFMSWVASGIKWAADNGAKVISMSLGSSSSSTAVASAVDYAWSKGCVIVAAAGNADTTTPSYPAYYTNVIAVAATDSFDNKASFSNYGSWVDVAAPGSSIYSTLPNHSNKIRGLNYGYLSGTSMATPAVAGVAALTYSSHTGASNATVRALVETRAEKTAPIYATFGIPRVNANNSVQP